MTEMKVPTGDITNLAPTVGEPVNEAELRALSTRLDREAHGEFSRWLTLREAAIVCNSDPKKLWYSVAKAKVRLEGVKRGPLWFVERGDVLAYASVLLERRYQAARRRLKQQETLYKRATGQPVRGRQPKVAPKMIEEG